MSNVVIVIDMIKGFMQEQYPLYCGPESKKIIPEIQKLLEKEIAGGATILYLTDAHDEDDKEFEMFPPHCIAGTEETEIIPELAERFPGERIPKKRFSCFYKTSLKERLEQLNPEKLVIVGVCTDICVMHTVADARNRDFKVEVPAHCVASFDQEAHEWALKHMEKVLGAEISRWD
jgi:nicotinamidase-related amidase